MSNPYIEIRADDDDASPSETIARKFVERVGDPNHDTVIIEARRAGEAVLELAAHAPEPRIFAASEIHRVERALSAGRGNLPKFAPLAFQAMAWAVDEGFRRSAPSADTGSTAPAKRRVERAIAAENAQYANSVNYAPVGSRTRHAA